MDPGFAVEFVPSSVNIQLNLAVFPRLPACPASSPTPRVYLFGKARISLRSYSIILLLLQSAHEYGDVPGLAMAKKPRQKISYGELGPPRALLSELPV